jgi:Fe-S-cluster-containing hydrogenase component 2
LLRDQARNATCSALDAVDLVKIGRESFQLMLDRFPVVRATLDQVAVARIEAGKERKLPVGLQLDEFLDQGLFEAQNLLLIDLDNCTRCDACVNACADAHDGVTRLIRDGLRYDRFLVATACRSCRDPLCMTQCPVGSIRRKESLEIIIEDWCIGCSKCAELCPYGNINMHSFEVTKEVEVKAAAPAKKDAPAKAAAPAASKAAAPVANAARTAAASEPAAVGPAPKVTVVADRVDPTGEKTDGPTTPAAVPATAATVPQPVPEVRDTAAPTAPVAPAAQPVEKPAAPAGAKPAAAPAKPAAPAPPKKTERKKVSVSKATTCDLCTQLSVPSCVYACPHDAAKRVDPTEFLSRQIGQRGDGSRFSWLPKRDSRTTH